MMVSDEYVTRFSAKDEGTGEAFGKLIAGHQNASNAAKKHAEANEGFNTSERKLETLIRSGTMNFAGLTSAVNSGGNAMQLVARTSGFLGNALGGLGGPLSLAVLAVGSIAEGLALFSAKTETAEEKASALSAALSGVSVSFDVLQKAVSKGDISYVAAKALTDIEKIIKAKESEKKISETADALEKISLETKKKYTEALERQENAHEALNRTITLGKTAYENYDRELIASKQSVAVADEEVTKLKNSMANMADKTGKAMGALMGLAKAAEQANVPLITLDQTLHAFSDDFALTLSEFQPFNLSLRQLNGNLIDMQPAMQTAKELTDEFLTYGLMDAKEYVRLLQLIQTETRKTGQVTAYVQEQEGVAMKQKLAIASAVASQVGGLIGAIAAYETATGKASFKEMQNIRAIEVAVNTAAAVMGAFATYGPTPAGYAMAAAMTATGIIQEAAIYAAKPGITAMPSQPNFGGSTSGGSTGGNGPGASSGGFSGGSSGGGYSVFNFYFRGDPDAMTVRKLKAVLYEGGVVETNSSGVRYRIPT